MKLTTPPRRAAARTVLALSLLVGASAALGACNTTSGLGKDVSATGNAVTNTADKAKQGL